MAVARLKQLTASHYYLAAAGFEPPAPAVWRQESTGSSSRNP